MINTFPCIMQAFTNPHKSENRIFKKPEVHLFQPKAHDYDMTASKSDNNFTLNPLTRRYPISPLYTRQLEFSALIKASTTMSANITVPPKKGLFG